MMYGRIPRGPLSLLKDSWVDESLPVNIGPSVASYLSELKRRLEVAADKALEY